MNETNPNFRTVSIKKEVIELVEKEIENNLRYDSIAGFVKIAILEKLKIL